MIRRCREETSYNKFLICEEFPADASVRLYDNSGSAGKASFTEVYTSNRKFWLGCLSKDSASLNAMCKPLIFILTLILSSYLAAREPWSTSRVSGSPESAKPYSTERVHPNLQFDQPVELLALGNTGKMLLLEVGGKVFTFDDRPNCTKADLALDLVPLSDNFDRALGIGVPPDFDQKHELYICYAAKPVARADGTRLSRFRMELNDSPHIDPDSEEILLTWASGGHNGCAIRFDRKGLLYFSAGDGARPYPPDEYDVSQDLADLRATICRIDVNDRDDGKAYAIPHDNPFVATPHARAEIWAYGFRNPWRFTIDPMSEKIYCGDVGWELWELIHDVQRAGNHGWSIFEGPQPIRSDIKPGPTPIIKPLFSYPHTEGLSVTGGVFYRGDALPDLKGTYLYGDFVTGLLWGLRASGDQLESNELLAETGLKIITFTEGRDREVLVVSFDGGIYRLSKNPLANTASNFPRTLSETGLFASTTTLEPSSGVLPYEITAHAWQDGASSQFAVGIPGSGTIQLAAQQRNWQYPIGTVFAKTISQRVLVDNLPQLRRVETQILVFEGLMWQPYTYAWNAEQTDAELVGTTGGLSDFLVVGNSGKSEDARPWQFQSRAECRACHSNQAGGAVAFTPANIASIAGHNLDKGESSEATDLLLSCGLTENVPPALKQTQRMVDPADSTATLEQRARSYLAANCAHCHCRGGGGTVALDVSYTNASDSIFAIDFPATQGTFGMDQAKVIVPGDPYRSVLYYRMATSGTGHMPKLWSCDNDSAGLALLHDWIASLKEGASQDTPHSKTQTDSVSDALQKFHELIVRGDASDNQAVAHKWFVAADPLTRGLFERFLPASQRVQRLGSRIDAAALLTRTGNAEAGRERFLNSKAQQCRNCHRYAEQGRSVGPDLDGIAKKRSRGELLESILEPSKKIEPEFATYAVVTADGQLISGLRIEQSSATTVIRSADGQEHRMAAEEIEQMSMQSTSLMPVGLAAEMTAEELADLLEFLSSLK